MSIYEGKTIWNYKHMRGKEYMELLKKYKDVISYLVFGGLTTVINVVIYAVLYNYLGAPNLVSTFIAWLVSVVFAFVTNKLFVFESTSWKLQTALYELATFFGCRILTGILDMVIMYLAVDVMGWNGTLWKILSNVLVIILNYIASKLLIFKRKE